VARLEVPQNLAAHPAFEEPAKCLALLQREAGGKYPICAYVTATMTLPVLLMGMEKWMELLLMGPASVRDELLAKCHDFFVKEVAAYRNAGANVLVYSNPFGSTDTVSRKWFAAHSLRWIEQDIRAVGVAGIVYYCGMSRMGNVVGTILERTGIGVYYLSPMDDIPEAKRVIAGRGLTCGVINDIQLVRWTREEIRTKVKRMMEVGKPGGRFLFGTGVMPLAIPEANLRAMLEFALEYGSGEP
jgi:uroporphyrinogen-III decarboxylase